MPLLKCPDCLNDVSDMAPSCPRCGRTLAAGKAPKLRKSEFIGVGCIVQGLGLALPFVGAFLAGPVGAGFGVVGLLVLLVVGGRMATFLVCGRCGMKLPDGRAAACPGCRSELLAG